MLAEGDTLDDLLTGPSFGPAALTVWSVEAIDVAAPIPTGLPLLLTGLGAIAFVLRRSRRA